MISEPRTARAKRAGLWKELKALEVGKLSKIVIAAVFSPLPAIDINCRRREKCEQAAEALEEYLEREFSPSALKIRLLSLQRIFRNVREYYPPEE